MAGPGSAKSSGTGDGGDLNVSASLASDEASKYVSASMETLAAIEVSREQGWTEVTYSEVEGAAGSSSRGRSAEDQLLWEKLKEEAPEMFVEKLPGLKLGQLIAEGGQGKIYKAFVSGCNPLVAKVFKREGFSLVDLHRHWPRTIVGALTIEPSLRSKRRSATTKGGLGFDLLCLSKRRSAPPIALNEGYINGFFNYAYLCFVWWGLFLEDGSFAFILSRSWGDLRKLINLRVADKNGQGPPFSNDEVGNIILSIAVGMQRLHENGVLHRDLKAANVLCAANSHNMEAIACVVADFESSMLVQGTGFWRAPEVLEDLQKNHCDRNIEIWTEKVDVYSFAMTCYEVMTGNIPFLGYVKSDWKRVIDGERPHLPDYVDPQLGELVERCWHKKPSERPTFDGIVKSLSEFQLCKGVLFASRKRGPPCTNDRTVSC